MSAIPDTFAQWSCGGNVIRHDIVAASTPVLAMQDGEIRKRF